MRAERRLGTMLHEQKEAVGLASGGDAMRARFRESTEVRPTLSDIGIDKKLSSSRLHPASGIVARHKGNFSKGIESIPTQRTQALCYFQLGRKNQNAKSVAYFSKVVSHRALAHRALPKLLRRAR